MGTTFRLEEQLRSGARSAVWRARQRPLGKAVVLKFFRLADDTPAAREHLALEMSLLRDLQHPNNLRLLDVGGVVEELDPTLANLPFAVFEHVPGQTLRQVITARRRLSPLQAWRVGLQALGALAEAHRAGLLHRDLTPSNLMLWQPTGLEQHVKIIDYGVGHPMPTAHGASWVIGTPHYLAPEVARGVAPSPQSDHYALAVVLYEALAGCRPFEGPDRRSVLEAHARGAPTPLADEVPVPEDLASIVHRALAPDPADRFESTRAFLEALQGLSWRKLRRYHFAEFAPMPEEETILTDIFEPRAWEAATGLAAEPVASSSVVGLRAIGRPSIWLFGDDPATRDPAVERAAAVLGERYEVVVLGSEQREERLEALVAGTLSAPWVAVFGDLHTLVQDRLLTHLRNEVETSRMLLSTHLNSKMIQTSVNFAGLDQHLSLPSEGAELVASMEKMVERARLVRHRGDQLRLALRDARSDVARLRASRAQGAVPPSAPLAREGHR